MKCFEKIKLKIVLLIVLIIAVVGIGTTYAYLTSSTNNLENTFTVGKIETEIEENPEIQGSNIKKDPSVKNIGSNDCIIRMRVTVSPKVIADYLSQNNGINYKTESWRYNNSDGFWYYLGIVSPGKATDPLFTEVNDLLDADGKIKEEFKNVSDFEITLYQEAVQAVVWDADGNELSAMDSNNKFNHENALKVWSAYKGSLD